MGTLLCQYCKNDVSEKELFNNRENTLNGGASSFAVLNSNSNFYDKNTSNKHEIEAFGVTLSKSTDDLEPHEVDKVKAKSNLKANSEAEKVDHKFNIETKNSEAKIKEIELANDKKHIMEKVSVQLELQNLLPKLHKDKQFLVEVLFANTHEESAFFSIGATSNYKPNDKMNIQFKETFEVGYLFERTQKIRLIIHCSDNTKSEVTVNIAKVIFRKLDPIKMPINLQENSITEFSTDQVSSKDTDQVLYLTFKRTTEFLDSKLTNLWIEFTYPVASMTAKRLRYVLIAEDINKKLHTLFKSNEINGKSPLVFANALFDNHELFTKEELTKYYIEFYEESELYGKTTIGRKEMDSLLKAKDPVTYTCIGALNLFNLEEREKKVKEDKGDKGDKIEKTNNNKLGANLGNKALKPSSSSKKLTGSNKNLALSPVKKESQTEEKKGFDNKIRVFIKEIQRKKFIDYILEGMNVSFDVGIDFTSSNLDPINPDSLHTLKLESNRYCKAIKSCGGILENYDRYHQFQVFGFGGVPKNGKEVSHCFNLNGKKDGTIKGLEEVINTYKEMVKSISFVGPSWLHFVIKNVVESVKKDIKKDPKCYKVFLIMTDGVIEDMNETLDILVEASRLPISIIIVGIGNGDFGKMDELDGDEVPICSPTTGEVRYRDIVQFVKFSDFENDGIKLAAEVLREVPDQVEEYSRMTLPLKLL